MTIGLRNLVDAIDYLSIGYDVAGAMNAIPISILYSIPILTIVASIPEEFLFRTLMQTTLTERIGRIHGILISSLIFGMAHIISQFSFFLLLAGSVETALFHAIVITFVCHSQIGILFAVAWERTRSLVLPLSLHTANNVAEMIPYYWFWLLGVMA